jgi:hypothetical protein
MEKGRHPNVIRTWTVQRTRVPYKPPQAATLRPNPRQDLLRGPGKNPHAPGAPPPISGPKTSK